MFAMFVSLIDVVQMSTAPFSIQFPKELPEMHDLPMIYSLSENFKLVLQKNVS